MALKIRLTRQGAKGNPFYRVVVAESRSPRDGKFIDVIGTYDPKGVDITSITFDKAKATEWLAKGATPTETARAVLVKAGVLAQEKPKKKTSTPKPAAKPANKKKEK